MQSEIEKTFETSQVILIVTSSEKYNKAILNTMKQLRGMSLCYVTLNKTAASLEQTFAKNRIPTDNIFFVDAISKTLLETGNLKNRIVLLTPGALTEMSLVINEILSQKFDYFVFDALNNLSIYQQKEDILRFVLFVINKIRKTNTKAVFYAVKGTDLIPSVSTMVDEVMEE